MEINKKEKLFDSSETKFTLHTNPALTSIFQQNSLTCLDNEFLGQIKLFFNFRIKVQNFKAMEIEIKNLNNLVIEKNKIIARLEEQLVIEKEEKVDLVNEYDKYKQETQKQQELWSEETAKLREELENINEIVKTNEKGAEENLKVRIEKEKEIIMNEADSDREAYQRLLHEYHTLEQHCEELKNQMNAQNHMGAHRRNASDVSSVYTADEQLLSTDLPEDHGYGSVRSTTSNGHLREKLENIDWKQEGLLFDLFMVIKIEVIPITK